MKSFLAILGLGEKPTIATLDNARTLIATVSANAEKLGRMFTAASLDLDALLAKGDNALAEHINTALSAARVQAKNEAHAELLTALNLKAAEGQSAEAAIKTAIEASGSQVTTLTAQVATLTGGMAKAGVVVKAADEKKGVQESDVHTALENRISIKAAELTAQLGTKPVAAQVVAAPAAAARAGATEGLTGLARVQASFEADRRK